MKACFKEYSYIFRFMLCFLNISIALYFYCLLAIFEKMLGERFFLVLIMKSGDWHQLCATRRMDSMLQGWSRIFKGEVTKE